MGVKGLLPCLESITKKVSLEKYRGLTAAVDAMCWLHKGVFTGDVRALAKYQFRSVQEVDPSSVSQEECNGESSCVSGISGEEDASLVKKLNFDQFASTRKPSCRNRHQRNRHDCADFEAKEDAVNAKIAMSKCVDYVIRHAEILKKQYGIEAVLVIDGGSLPCKAGINKKRRVDRAEAFEKGLLADKRGDSRDARRQYSRACSITYEMRHELTLQCKLRKIPFVVAPYEADAQVAKLAHSGLADFIISEDSDLLAYACPRVLFKLDFRTGKGDEIQVMRDLASNKTPSFRHWSHDMFVYMCILSGCDYCEGVPGVGIQTAHKLVRIHRKPSKIFNALRITGKLPQNFEEVFWVAYRTFRHQRIYCPQGRVSEALFPIQERGDHNRMWEFLGPWVEPSIAIGIAEGKLHPSQKVPWDQVRHTLHEKRQKPSNVPCPEKQSQGRKYASTDDNLFSFFRPNISKSPNRKVQNSKFPPLREIRIDKNIHNHISDSGESVPSNFHDYSSNLVAETFEPLSRRTNPIRASQKRRGATKAFKKLKDRLSLKMVLEREREKKIKRSAESSAVAKLPSTPSEIKRIKWRNDNQSHEIQNTVDYAESTNFGADSDSRFDYEADEYPISHRPCNNFDASYNFLKEEYRGLGSGGDASKSMLPSFEGGVSLNCQQESDSISFAYDSTFVSNEVNFPLSHSESSSSDRATFSDHEFKYVSRESPNECSEFPFHPNATDCFHLPQNDHEDFAPSRDDDFDGVATEKFDYGSTLGEPYSDVQPLPQCHVDEWDREDDDLATDNTPHDWEIFQRL